MLTHTIAQMLDLAPEALERASLRVYVEARLRETEAQLFLLAKKHGVHTVQEFVAAAQAGRIPESDGFEDFFAVDHPVWHRDRASAESKIPAPNS